MTIHTRNTGTGIPLVLFHGWGFDSRIWQPVLPHLIGFEVFCVDLPGCGQTPVMTWEAFKSVLLKQLPERFVLAGWSMGGLLATRFAIEAPGHVLRLLNVASSPYFLTEETWPGVEKHVFASFYEQLEHDPQKVLTDFLALQLPRGYSCTLPFKESDGLAWGLEVLFNCDLRADLSKLTIPVKYLFGRLDAIVPRRTMDVMKTTYPQFCYELVDRAAHAIFLSHPDVFARNLNG